MRWLALVVLTMPVAGALSAEENRVPMTIKGDTLALVKTEPGNLCFDGIVKGSVTVRSTYMPTQEGCVTYEEDRDYVVDYEHGTVARTTDSRIVDFATNMLYGQKNFNHADFPGWGNQGFFAYVDYETTKGYALSEPSNQAALLKETARKLAAGGPFAVLAYGDSITAGMDIASEDFRFQRHYARYLGERFPKAEITVENGATSGDSTVTGLSRLEEKVLSRTPDLVLLGFGMNDHNKNGVPEQQFEDNLVTLVNRIREGTGAEVLMYSTFPPNPEWVHGSHRMDVYAAATRRAAKRAQCAYADLYSVWMTVAKRKDPPSMLGNNINHPNEFGHWLYFLALKSVEF
ncbi:MAG: SGNH/GDSL hydrolase family protein [bacterium]|nr:SGNH/GDSL hydrolase family protein [bacterium]